MKRSESVNLFIYFHQSISTVLTVGWSQAVMFPHMKPVLRPDGFSEGDFSLEIVPAPGAVLVGNNLLDLLVVWLEDFLHFLLRLGDTLRLQAVIQPPQQLHGVLHPVDAEGVERVGVSPQEMVVEKSVCPQPVAENVPALLVERGHEVFFPGVELDKGHLQSQSETRSIK